MDFWHSRKFYTVGVFGVDKKIVTCLKEHKLKSEKGKLELEGKFEKLKMAES